jgi:hypothetical protein
MLLLAALLLANVPEGAAAEAGPDLSAVTISNVEPRRDSEGNILNAHDGALYSFSPGHYLLIGTSYAECESFTNCSSHIGDCGWQDNNFSAYSSSDLQTWHLESSDMVPARPRGGANFRPKIVQNNAGTYVMWYNFQPPTPNIPGYYTVATSDKAAGPYRILHEQVNVSMPLNGDFNLFVDEENDRAGYIVYNSDKNGDLCGACHIPPCDCGFQMSVEKLSADFTTSTMENSGWIGAPTVEAPAMFKRKGIYYLLFDRLSCFGPQGSGAVVYTSRHPMGPFVAQGNINRNGIKYLACETTEFEQHVAAIHSNPDCCSCYPIIETRTLVFTEDFAPRGAG